MSAHTERARELIDKANVCRTEGAIGFLVLAMEALCDELEEHQHSYNSPGDSCRGSHWEKTEGAR